MSAKAVKVSNEKSKYGPPKPSISVADAETLAYNKLEAKDEKIQRCFDLTLRFKKHLNDKTLPENRTILNKEVEKDIIKDLIYTAQLLNTDEMQEEGMGSLGLITLLLNIVLEQRDKINILSYEIEKLKKERQTKAPSQSDEPR